MNNFKVSTIIPVYNAEKYVRKAVESAVDLSEVGEIILIEDASPDNTLSICKKLAKEYKKVRLIQHPNSENRGAGASRNLGLKNAQFDFIAFLDADDWYLPNRFTKAKQIFISQPQVDGVYEPVGTFFHADSCFYKGKIRSKSEGEKMVSFMKEPVNSKDLFYYLLEANKGAFCTDGIIIKKKLVKKVGYFSENLRLHQDTEYWVRCAYYGNLVAPEHPEIIAIRSVHSGNRISNVNFHSRSKYEYAIYSRFKKLPLTWKEKFKVFRKNVSYHHNLRFKNSNFMLKFLEYTLVSFNYISIFFSKNRN